MLIEIKDNYVSDMNDASKEFFKLNGELKESDGWQSSEDKEAGLIAKKVYEFRFVGHIEQVPVEVLNKHSGRITYLKGVQSFVSKAVGSSIEETQRLNMGAVSIHLPSNELLHINQTLLLEDSCTDELQKHLDIEWRIVACIPRPGQRRPDYILGRHK